MILNTLPATKFTWRDGRVSTTPPPPTGDTVMIVGQALDGPVNQPISLQNLPIDVSSFFGPNVYTSDYPSPDGDPTKLGQYSGNSLISSMQEAIQGGAGSVILVRVGGNTATDGTNMLLGGITVSARFPGSVYNGATVTAVATTGGITISCTQPGIKGGNFSLVLGPTITYDSAAGQFNADIRNGSFVLYVPLAIANYTGVDNPSASVTCTLAGGTNGTLRDDFAGTSKSALYQALTDPVTGTFAYIDGWEADSLYIAGIYADDDINNIATQSFITDLAVFCYTQSANDYPTIGYIGVRPLRNPTMPAIRARVANLLSTGTNYADSTTLQLTLGQFIQNGIPYTDPDTGMSVDIGRHVNIHAGPDVFFNDIARGSYLENPAAYYTGLVANLPPQVGALNQQVQGLQPFYNYTRSQLNQLDAGVGATLANNAQGGGAYVTFRQANQQGNTSIRVTDDNTAASRLSLYANLQAVRIVQHAEDVVHDIGTLFLGQPSNPATITALTSQLRTGLDTLAAQGCFNGGYGSGYSFTVQPIGNTGKLGQINISMSLKPAYEIRDINTDVSVTQ